MDILAIINNAAMNIGVHIFFLIGVLGLIPRIYSQEMGSTGQPKYPISR